MLNFLFEHLGTIVVGLGLLVVLLLAGRSVYRNKKSGGCAGGCPGCSHSCNERHEH